MQTCVSYGGAVPFEERDIFTMDLLSITDLVSGAVEQYFTSEKNNGIPSVKDGAEKIIKWLSTPGTALKKEVIRITTQNEKYIIDGIKYKEE